MISMEEKVKHSIDDLFENNKGTYVFGNKLDKDGHPINVYHFEPLYKFDGDKNVNKGRYIYAIRFNYGIKIDRSSMSMLQPKYKDIISVIYGREKLILIFIDLITYIEKFPMLWSKERIDI